MNEFQGAGNADANFTGSSYKTALQPLSSDCKETLCSPMWHYHKAYDLGAKRREGERKGANNIITYFGFSSTFLFKYFFPSELVSIKRASLVELLQ